MTSNQLPNAVILPRDNCKKLLNIEPTILTRSDMTSDYAWYRLAKLHCAVLEEKDFKNKDTFRKYWLLSLGLLDFPIVAVGGDPESGKSLFMAWLTERKHSLFDKDACLDWTPPQPKYFGNYHDLMDSDFQNKIVDEFDILHRIEQETRRPVPLEIRKKLILFNAEMGLDEADGYLHRQMQTNTTKVIGMIERRRRHLFMGMTLVMIEPKEFADVVLNQVTHKATCYWEGHLPNTCSILIEDVRRGGTGLAKWLWLRPKDWTHLWDSHNIPAMTHRTTVSFGKLTKKEEELKEIRYQEFIEKNMHYFDDDIKNILLQTARR